MTSHYQDSVNVDSRFHSKLLDGGPTSVSNFIKANHLKARVFKSNHTASANDSCIYIEGDQKAVEMVKEEIIKNSKKWVSDIF